jgi:diguanylate cyclase (GGDEF)-like protein
VKLDASERISFARPAFLTVIVVVSVVTILLFPLFTLFYQYPSFTGLLKEFTLNEAVGVARYLASFLTPEGRPLEPGSLDADLLRRIDRVERDAHFLRLRIYSPSGEILYSNEAGEIGQVNRNPYFQHILATRQTVAVEVDRDSLSLEKEYVGADVIEAYVPIVQDARLLGVFEIYYNISPQKQKLSRLINLSTGVLFAMAGVLLAGVLFSLSRARQYLRDRQRVLEELRTLSLSDELTGVYNRRGFFLLAEQQIRIARRTQRGMLLVSADLDGLKRINDDFGHHEGDRALVDAAQILRESFRESDIIARIGGDEFVVLMTEKPDISAEVLSERLNKNLEIHNNRVQRPYPFSISMGIVAFDPQEVATLNDLLVRADQAMYANKRRRQQGGGWGGPGQAP